MFYDWNNTIKVILDHTHKHIYSKHIDWLSPYAISQRHKQSGL